jgi:adenosylmethionine-8-amino-7-oxononanoate aminotransferase
MSAFLHPFTPPRQTDFIRLVGGEGSTVWDAEGNRYIDAMASLWYMNVGHGRPEMVEAIATQAAQLASYHAYAPFTNEPAEELAEMIIVVSPYDRGRVFYGSSGSEAVDSAMKIARIAQREAGHPERTIIISREHGYHGSNFGGLSAQGIPINQEGFGALVGDVVNVAAGNVETIAQVFDQNPGRVAAVLTEPLQGAGGVLPPPEGYLESLRTLCDHHGAYLIFDEVICGFGRLGEWFGSQYYGVTPDMFTFAKAVTSGYLPLGGVAIGPTVTDALERNEGFVLRHGYTYSGHPTATAAAIAAIEIQKRERLVNRAGDIGSRLSAGLESLLADGLVTEVRGVGAVWAVELPDHLEAAAVRDDVLAAGVILRPLGNALVMCPPLVITDDEIDRIVDAVGSCVTAG